MTGRDVEQMDLRELEELIHRVKGWVDQLLAERETPAERRAQLRVVGGAS